MTVPLNALGAAAAETAMVIDRGYKRKMIIRDATEADVPAIVEIFNTTIPSRMVSATLEPVSVEERLTWFRAHSPEHPLWVMCEPNRVNAWLSLQTFLPRCAYAGTAEVSVYVRENFRRCGVARSLIDEAIARAPSLGITALVGHIFAHNEPSLRFFAKAGFERWGLLPRVAKLDGVERDLVIVGRHVAQA